MPLFLMVLSALVGCRRAPPPVAAEAPLSVMVAPDLEVTALRPGVWLVTTWRGRPGADRVGDNGLLVADPDGGLLLVDVPRGAPATEALLAWVQTELGKPIEAAVVTAVPEDAAGSIAALVAHRIPVVGHPRTVVLAGDQPIHALRTLEASDAVYLGAAEVFYPGPGHSSDNVVAWLPDSSVLFGGSLVASGDASDLGDPPGADRVSWAIALDRVLLRYPDAVLVVPGKGVPGGLALLSHTRTLLAAAERVPPPPLTNTHRELCEHLAGPVGAARLSSEDPAELGPTGASSLESWVLTGADLGLSVALGFPLRSDLAFQHPGGKLVCSDPYGVIAPSVLQDRRHCEPLADESDVWWWCPDEP